MRVGAGYWKGRALEREYFLKPEHYLYSNHPTLQQPSKDRMVTYTFDCMETHAYHNVTMC